MKYKYEMETKGHIWKRNEDGSLDVFGYSNDGSCNGPVCSKCGYGFCHHCQQLPSRECPVSNEDYLKKIFTPKDRA